MEGLTPEQVQQMQEQCIFCHIVNGRVAARKVYEDDKVIAVLDINPANPGHILLITKEHFMVMPQIPDDVVEHIGMTAKGLSHALLKALKADGTTIFIANGVTAGQRAQHFMLHIIPRMENDGIGIMIPQREMAEEDFKKVMTAITSGIEKHLGKIPGLGEEIEEEEEKIEKAEKKAEKEGAKEKNQQKEQGAKSKSLAKENESKEQKAKPKKDSSGLDDIARLFTK